MSRRRYIIAVHEYDDDPITGERTYSEPHLAYVKGTEDLGFELRSAICDAQRIANDGIEHQFVAVAYQNLSAVGVEFIAVRGVEYDPIRGQFVGQSADELDEELYRW